MLATISGSQGSGKSTLLKILESKGYKTIQRKTSRSILEDWNVTLEEVNNNRELAIKFQEEIISRKTKDELIALSNPNEIWFTERTFMDLAIYNLIALGSDNKQSDFVTEYYNKCVSYSQKYGLTFYLKAGHFTPVNDGVRGVNPFYSRMVDLVLEDALKTSLLPDRLVVIDTPVLSQRIHLIETLTKAKMKCSAHPVV